MYDQEARDREILAAIEERYRPELEACTKELNGVDMQKEPERYLEAAARFTDVHGRYMEELDRHRDEMEIRRLSSFNGDIPLITKTIKDQILSFIYMAYAMAGEEPTAKERAEREKRIEEEKVNVKKAIEHNERLLARPTNDQAFLEELRKNTQELRETDPEQVLDFHFDMFFSERGLKARITESFAVQLDFIAKTDPAAHKELLEVIDIAVKKRHELIKARIGEVDKAGKSRTSPKKQAELEGVITCLGDYSATITDKKYRYALTPLKDNHAYIQRLDEDFIQQLEFNPENGVMSFRERKQEPITIKNAVTNSNIKELDLQLLRSLYTIIYNNAEEIGRDTVTIYLPTLTEHLGIRINNSKPNDLFKKIRAFENTVGVLNNRAIYKLLDFLKYEPDGNLITFASPYMNTILRQLQRDNKKRTKKGIEYENPFHSYLVHGDMANERNKPAIEVVQIIVTLLQQRGDAKNGVTTANIKFSTIIEQIPELKEKLSGNTTAGNKNNYLKRTFQKAYELLRSKTDLYQYYTNLSIPEVIPSTTTVDQVIIITHSGKNKDYRQPN